LAAPAAWAADPVGRVSAVSGTATARSSDGKVRTLKCNDPIYADDEVRTAAGSSVGLFVGDYYAGLDERTIAGVRANRDGSPRLLLRDGHVRLLDGGSRAGATLQTPGLLAANSGRDTEGFAFREKAWVVSMICPRAGAAAVSRLVNGVRTGEGMSAGSGTCAVGKPTEPIYSADASHAPLAVASNYCPLPPLAALGASSRFGDPLPAVALGLPSVDAGPPAGAFDAGTPGVTRMACDVGCGLATLVGKSNAPLAGGPPGGGAPGGGGGPPGGGGGAP
jgi:hypothetical protein